MKNNTKEDVSQIIQKIQKADFSRIEIRALLISLRFAPPHYQSIKDLANFVAHEEERNQGIFQDNVKGFVDRFVEFTKIGGIYKAPDPVFNQSDIISQLYKTIKMQGILNLDKRLFCAQAFNIMLKILEIVADTKIQTNNGDIQNCYLSSVEKNNDEFIVYFCFEPKYSANKWLNAKTVKMPALKTGSTK